MELKEKIAIVTGGASGLGEACVRRFVLEGASVGILDVDEDNGRRLVAELGEKVIFCRTDVTGEESVQAAVDRAVAEFGGIHVVINCAGVGTPAKVLGKNGPMALEHFNRVLQINLTGTMNVIRLAAARIVENTPNADGEKGVVINTASAAAFDGQIGQAAYSASKGGVVGMMLPLAREFAQFGIRVNTIAPGIFKTPMIAGMPEEVQDSIGKQVPFPPRLGAPEEYADTAAFIYGNPMVNGETIRVDGAIRMQPK